MISILFPHGNDVNQRLLKIPKQAQSFSINHTDPQLFQIDVEMVSSFTYTSLKDLPPAPSIKSAYYNRRDSWREIPMKDPLLQQAVWAYLRPTECEADNRSFAAKLKDMCCGYFGCFGGFLDEVVWTTIKRLFFGNESIDGEAVKVD